MSRTFAAVDPLWNNILRGYHDEKNRTCHSSASCTRAAHGVLVAVVGAQGHSQPPWARPAQSLPAWHEWEAASRRNAALVMMMVVVVVGGQGRL